MTKKIKVGVIFGGPSSEREISLITGKAICENLDTKKYTVVPIEMTKDSRFVGSFKNGKKNIDFGGQHRKTFDVIFIALHGSPGEDGALQGMFDSLGIKYTGPGVLASALAMNKAYAGQVYWQNNLPHPKFVDFKRENWKVNKKILLSLIKKVVGIPAVVKPVDQGSAVGVKIVKTEAELEKNISEIIKKFSWVMVQEFIAGDEATCGVLEKNGKPFALPPTRIMPQLGEFYDFKSKYKKGGSTHICPADFNPIINKQLQSLALRAHKALGCRGMSRTDVMVGENFKLFILETNTIPGMTPTSLMPEAAGKAGIGFSKMLDLIVQASL
jgi:D-alanine-D-alanine ligase